jgi:RHS repeat-associated protein
LANHLGNVQVVVSDRKVPQDTNADALIDYFVADVVSATDYYAFGAVMPDRSFNAAGYRYGFNGKENDNEVKGTGNQQDYGMRIYDGRIGKFLSVDPLTNKYPHYTPYQFAGNMPIWAIDLDGAEELISTTNNKDGTVLRVYSWPDGLKREFDYPNGAMATHNDGDVYWRYSRMNEYGRSEFYRSKGGEGWEKYKDEEADYRSGIKSADQFGKVIVTAVVAPLLIPFSGLSAGLVTAKGVVGGVADLTIQLASNGRNINDVNWTSVGANVLIGNPLVSAGVGSVFDSRDGKNAITGDKDLKTVVTETASGAVGNVIGGKLSGSLENALLPGAGTFLGNTVGNAATNLILQPIADKAANAISPPNSPKNEENKPK